MNVVSMTILSKEQKLEILSRILRSRYFEEKVSELFEAGMFPGAAHLSVGQEAGAVGACFALASGDYMVGTHRSHGHPIANNADIKYLMAEILGKVTGVNRGKGGSMHLADKKVGSLGESSILGSGLPIACGAALASKIRKEGKVALAFFGDGSANEGVVHESMNIASTWKLPVIFALENNGVAVTTLSKDSSAIEDLYLRAAGYGMPGESVDGQDPEAVYAAVKKAVDKARRGEGPSLVEIKTYRFREHGEGVVFKNFTKTGYRDAIAHKDWIENRDPVKTYPAKLIACNVMTETEYNELCLTERERVEAAAAFAIESPFPEPGEAFEGVYAMSLSDVW